MTAEVELLPCGECGMPCRPGEYHPYAACLMFKTCRNSDTVRGNLQDAQDHATAAKDAEIEALRAEVGELHMHAKRRDQYAVEKAAQALDWKKRADKLAEALDIIARVGKASRNKTTRTRWIVARAISALNGDEDWQALPKPKGFHDALLHPTAAQENDDA